MAWGRPRYASYCDTRLETTLAPSTRFGKKQAPAFPKGVAAKVHVDGVTWLVFRPYGAYSHSQAKQCSALEELFGTDASGDFQGYLASLESAFIGRLTAQSLPGTNQPLEWRHLLAWCIRDQKTRFDGFFHWRDGEGVGFRRPRKDPPLFVSSVLGLLDADLDRLMRETEAAQGALEQLEARLPELERAPAYALAHAERQLRGWLRPMRMSQSSKLRSVRQCSFVCQRCSAMLRLKKKSWSASIR